MPKSYTVDPARTPETPLLLHWFARFYLWLTGWRVVGHLPADRKMIVTAGPHTANQDGWMMVLTSWVIRADLKWMVKAELTRGFIGWFIRAAGGVGIDRKSSRNTVEQVVQQFEERDSLLLAVAPEGTRRHLDHWKTGFYWMAVGANVPIYMGRLDYENKIINLAHPPVHPTGDIDTEMQIIFDAYSEVTAKHPEKVSEMRLRRSGSKSPIRE
jgi:1-acyl-sn-glycerol-3-phosphate acyltransferase